VLVPGSGGERVPHDHAGGRTSTTTSTRSTATATTVVVLELLAAIAIVLGDVFVPTIVLLSLAVGSLLVRRERLASLGFHRVATPARMAGQVLAITVGWTLLQLALVIPVLEHLTGTRQDVDQFAAVEGDLPLLLSLLVLSWTLAAVGEELAFRGYVFTRVRELLPDRREATVAAVLVSSLLFALIHTEQGLIGVALTFLDALLFSVLRLSYRTLWASVLAHGLNNSIGLIAFFFVGPIYGLW